MYLCPDFSGGLGSLYDVKDMCDWPHVPHVAGLVPEQWRGMVVLQNIWRNHVFPHHIARPHSSGQHSLACGKILAVGFVPWTDAVRESATSPSLFWWKEFFLTGTASLRLELWQLACYCRQKTRIKFSPLQLIHLCHSTKNKILLTSIKLEKNS